MAIDPICQMEVDEATALSAEQEGATFYFCSEHCRTKFLKTTTEPASHAECCHAESATVAIQTSTPSESVQVRLPDVRGCRERVTGELSQVRNGARTGSTACTQPQDHLHLPDAPGDRAGSARYLPEVWDGVGAEVCHAEEQDEGDAELQNMTRRFWVSVVLGLPVFLLAMLPMVGVPLHQWIPPSVSKWAQFILCTPVVLWAGWPFFERGWRSVITWNLNMFTLIALGVGAAYFYSGFALLFPGLIPEAFREGGTVQVYFEAAAMITALVLLGRFWS